MRLERFGSYTFPLYNVTDQMGQGIASGDPVATAAGSYDAFGDDTVQSRNYQIIRRMELITNTPAELQTALDEVLALRGKRAKLFARTLGGDLRWAKARCVRVDYNRTARNFNHQGIDVVFEVLTTHWNGVSSIGDGWFLNTSNYVLDDGYYLDSDNKETMSTDPYTFTITNGGNRPVSDVSFTITAGGANITSVNLTNTTNGLTNITWTGTLSAGNALVLDGGTLSVTNNGADAYSGLAINAAHAMGEWFRLDAGSNSIVCDYAGGSTNSTISATYNDGWA